MGVVVKALRALSLHLQPTFRLAQPDTQRGIDWDELQHPRGSNGRFVGTAGGDHSPIGGEGYKAHREHAFLAKVVANAKAKAAGMSETQAHAFLKSIQARGLTGLNAINARMLHLNHTAQMGAAKLTHHDWQQLATLRSIYRSRVNNSRNQHQGPELNTYSRNRLNREIGFIDSFARRRGITIATTAALPRSQRDELAQVVDESIARDAARYAPKTTKRMITMDTTSRLILPEEIRGLDWDDLQHPRGSNGRFVGGGGHDMSPVGGEGYRAHREAAVLHKMIAGAKANAVTMHPERAAKYLGSQRFKGHQGIAAMESHYRNLQHIAETGAQNLSKSGWRELATLRSLYRTHLSSGKALNSETRKRLSREINHIDAFASRKGHNLQKGAQIPSDQKDRLSQIVDEAVARDAERFAPTAKRSSEMLRDIRMMLRTA